FVVLEMRRWTRQELARAELADEFAVADLDLAADGHQRRATFDLPAFERAVVDRHLLGLRGNLAAVGGVVDHQIGVAADGDRPLAGVEAEQLRSLRARG